MNMLDQISIHVSITPKLNGCWYWFGALSTRGYASFNYKRKSKHVHRVLYEYIKGKIKKGLVLDHLCRTRSCINPDHLEQVSNRENVLRGVGIASLNAKKRFCSRGHSLKDCRIYIRPDGLTMRVCRRCHNIQNTESRRRMKLLRHC